MVIRAMLALGIVVVIFAANGLSGFFG